MLTALTYQSDLRHGTPAEYYAHKPVRFEKNQYAAKNFTHRKIKNNLTKPNKNWYN